MSWKKNENRVSNPFGAPSQPSFGSVTSGAGGFGAFGMQTTNQSSTFGSSPFGAFGNAFQQPQRVSDGKGKGKGVIPAMMDDSTSSTTERVSNPFVSIGAKHAMTRDEAVNMYKTECMRLKGYPFSCLGPPDDVPPLQGDISPEELRWYLSQGSPDIQKAVSERAALLQTDLSDFVKAGLPAGISLSVQRSGPYLVPDPHFPSFVPRDQFVIHSAGTKPELSEEDKTVYATRRITGDTRIPMCPPPLESR